MKTKLKKLKKERNNSFLGKGRFCRKVERLCEKKNKKVIQIQSQTSLEQHKSKATENY